jgi:hypothetical protein
MSYSIQGSNRLTTGTQNTNRMLVCTVRVRRHGGVVGKSTAVFIRVRILTVVGITKSLQKAYKKLSVQLGSSLLLAASLLSCIPALNMRHQVHLHPFHHK